MEVIGSLDLPTPGMGPAEYPFSTGTNRVILRGKLGLTPQDIMTCNRNGEALCIAFAASSAEGYQDTAGKRSRSS